MIDTAYFISIFHGDHIFVSIISLDIQTHTYNLNVLLSLINIENILIV